MSTLWQLGSVIGGGLLALWLGIPLAATLRYDKGHGYLAELWEFTLVLKDALMAVLAGLAHKGYGGRNHYKW